MQMSINVKRVAALAQEENLDGILLADAGFATWGTWLPISVFRGGGVGVYISKDASVELFSHILEAWRLKRLASWAIIRLYSKSPPEGVKVEAESLRELLSKRFRGVRVGCESEACRLLGDAGIEAVDVTDRLWELRRVKTLEELRRMEEALTIAESALVQTLNGMLEGMSEVEVAGLHEHLLRRYGAEGHAFAQFDTLTIVAFGENTSYPHWDPGSTRLQRDMPVLIDTGALKANYRSDITRSFWFGDKPDPEWRKVLEAVEHAVNAAIDAVEPGVEAEKVDEAARRALGEYSRYFIHSTGHGVGVEVHEEPRVGPGSKMKLEKDMVFTIEPGVYLPGRFGIRIEQMVVVTERGARLLNHLPPILEPSR